MQLEQKVELNESCSSLLADIELVGKLKFSNLEHI